MDFVDVSQRLHITVGLILENKTVVIKGSGPLAGKRPVPQDTSATVRGESAAPMESRVMGICAGQEGSDSDLQQEMSFLVCLCSQGNEQCVFNLS